MSAQAIVAAVAEVRRALDHLDHSIAFDVSADRPTSVETMHRVRALCAATDRLYQAEWDTTGSPYRPRTEETNQ